MKVGKRAARVVPMMSNAFGPSAVANAAGRNCPRVIQTYRQYAQPVDRANQMALRFHRTHRNTSWTHAVRNHLFQIVLANTYQHCISHNLIPRGTTMYDFVTALMVEIHHIALAEVPPLMAHVIDLIVGPRRRCHVCGKKTAYECHGCPYKRSAFHPSGCFPAGH